MMAPEELRSKLGGVIAFPVTPFKEDDLSLDVDGYRTNVAELLKFDLCALVAAGGTGELYSLTPDELVQVVEATVAGAQAPRLPDAFQTRIFADFIGIIEPRIDCAVWEGLADRLNNGLRAALEYEVGRNPDLWRGARVTHSREQQDRSPSSRRPSCGR